jgi:hypothetical protein
MGVGVGVGVRVRVRVGVGDWRLEMRGCVGAGVSASVEAGPVGEQATRANKARERNRWRVNR